MGVSIPAKDQNQSKRTKGGEFLIKETAPESIFIAEELTEEQKMMRQAMVDFIDQEIEPHFELVDSVKGAKEFAPRLLEKAGDYGFLGIGVPEEYGGMESDFVTTLSNNEVGGGAYSMSLAIGVQTSIGIAPILLYGNPSQKAKYLPKLVTGEWKTCYCLTEPSSGSDANSAKSTAKLSEDGKNYILNGQKMWITNGGFANIFIVFARIDQDKNLSAFIVEENYGGISRGAEEKKMGIKGSSTRQLFFNNVPVPVENLLGERNGGFKIAVNVLNTGRIKLSSSSVGVCKKALGFAVKYANERVQFKQPISKFGAIQHKIAEMATKTYVGESALYRVGHDIDLT
ncbi:MAG: acyl-CoA dehydrogenase family protein, partial [Chitinophagales bacterium]